MEKYLKKKGRGSGRFAMIPFAIMDSDAFNSLSSDSVHVYLRMYRRFNGSNNGYIPFGCREAATQCNISKMTAQRAFKQLEEVGLIECIVPSSFNCRKKLAREWALTHLPIGKHVASGKWKNFKVNPSTKMKKDGTNTDTHVFDLENYIIR